MLGKVFTLRVLKIVKGKTAIAQESLYDCCRSRTLIQISVTSGFTNWNFAIQIVNEYYIPLARTKHCLYYRKAQMFVSCKCSQEFVCPFWVKWCIFRPTFSDPNSSWRQGIILCPDDEVSYDTYCVH